MLYLHKTIICPQSDFFRACFSSGMKESTDNTIEIEDDEDERIVTLLIRALYANEIDINRKEDIVPLLVLAEKYQLKSWSSVLAEHLTQNFTVDTFFECLALNLDLFPTIARHVSLYRKSNFEDISNHKDCMSLSPEQLTVIISPISDDCIRKAVILINKWVEVDAERIKHACELFKRLEQNTVSFSLWGQNALVSHQGSLLKKTSSSKWDCLVYGSKCNTFKVLLRKPMLMRVGFAVKKAERLDYSGVDGYFLDSRGELCGNYEGDRNFSERFNVENAIVEAKLENRTVSFSVNGSEHKIAFDYVTGDLYPAFDVYTKNAEIELLD